jgi:hypothetical protein
MICVLRSAPIGVALLIGFAAPAGAADAITSLDEYDVKSAIILNCHPSQDAADRAYLARGEALRRAAVQELRSEFNAVNPTHDRENGIRAEKELERKHAARIFDIQEQIRNYGCAWLDSSRREELGFEQGRPPAPAR